MAEARSNSPNDLRNRKRVLAADLGGTHLRSAIVDQTGKIGLANLINILNPEMIVIGGGVVNAWDLFERHMKHEVAKRAFPLFADLVKIMSGECGDDAGSLGAAKLAFCSDRKN